MIKIQILFSFVIMQATACAHVPIPITLKVQDDQKVPVASASVRMGSGEGGQSEGLTNENGKFTMMWKPVSGLGVQVEKSDFYTSRGELWIGSRKSPIPMENFYVTLKKVINPVPMIHKQVEMELPALNKPIGFDFEVGDWVSPYGEGKREDLIFTGEKSFVGKRDYPGRRDYEMKVTLTFPNEMDGIQGFFAPERLKVRSDQIPPQIAPTTGFVDAITLESMRRPTGERKDYRDERQMYIFRIRTEIDSEGKILEAQYGFIRGYIKTSGFGYDTIRLDFDYYLNPDPNPAARSLEYNGENLMKQAIPAYSNPTGSNALISIGLGNNENLNSAPYRNTGLWPTRSGSIVNRWLHGDYGVPAFIYVNELYRKCINEGGLDQ